MITTPQEILISRTQGKKRHYTFNLGTRGTATVQYESAFCKNAVIMINDLRWDYTRLGFWKKELQIEGKQSPYTKTKIKFGWGNRFEVRAEDNNKYFFRSEGFWRRRYVWYDSGGQKLMEITSNTFSRSRRGKVIMHQPLTDTLTWLMLLGWFQLILWEQQAAAVAAAS